MTGNREERRTPPEPPDEVLRRNAAKSMQWGEEA